MTSKDENGRTIITVIVRYSATQPQLPIAIADSYQEMADILGINVHKLYEWISRGYETIKKVSFYEDDEFDDIRL